MGWSEGVAISNTAMGWSFFTNGGEVISIIFIVKLEQIPIPQLVFNASIIDFGHIIIGFVQKDF